MKDVVGLIETGLGGDKKRKMRLLHSNVAVNLKTQVWLWVTGAS